MHLSEHFTLREMTLSQTAARQGIDNTPDDDAVAALRAVCEHVLEPVRAHYGVPFSPSSGFRCLALNRALGSKDSSQHIKGEAVDLEVPGVPNYELAAWIRDNLTFDQLILEFYTPGDPTSGWVHCSYVAGDNRLAALTIGPAGAQQGLVA